MKNIYKKFLFFENTAYYIFKLNDLFDMLFTLFDTLFLSYMEYVFLYLYFRSSVGNYRW